MVSEIHGDLFEHIDGPCVVAHGCNAQGVMGAGFARIVARDYPKVFETYKAYCSHPELGGVCWAQVDEELIFANMITQNFYGNWGGARLGWIRKAIQSIEEEYNPFFRYLAPQIGCGLGGLDWGNVKPLFEDSIIEWEIYHL